jgi:PadR family transcriptional regulator PadR
MGTGRHLGDLEELVLLSVLRLGNDAHGGAVRDMLRTQAGRRLSVSTVYVTLLRLEEKGYVRSWMGESTPERGGKAKRHFEIRPEGRRALELVRSVRDRMWKAVEARAR